VLRSVSLLFFYFGKWLFKEWKKWRDKKVLLAGFYSWSAPLGALSETIWLMGVALDQWV